MGYISNEVISIFKLILDQIESRDTNSVTGVHLGEGRGDDHHDMFIFHWVPLRIIQFVVDFTYRCY